MSTISPAFEKFVQEVQREIDSIVGSFADGVSWSDFGQAFDRLKIFAMRQVSGLAISGAEKKAYVMQALEVLLNSLTIPLPWYLVPLRPVIRYWFLIVAEGSIESILQFLIKNAPQEKAS